MEEILSFKIDRVIGIDPSSMKRTLSRYVYPLSLFLSLSHTTLLYTFTHTRAFRLLPSKSGHASLIIPFGLLFAETGLSSLTMCTVTRNSCLPIGNSGLASETCGNTNAAKHHVVQESRLLLLLLVITETDSLSLPLSINDLPYNL